VVVAGRIVAPAVERRVESVEGAEGLRALGEQAPKPAEAVLVVRAGVVVPADVPAWTEAWVQEEPAASAAHRLRADVNG
jgi:hypothetical protein